MQQKKYACVRYLHSKVTVYHPCKIDQRYSKAVHSCNECKLLQNGLPCSAIHYGMCRAVAFPTVTNRSGASTPGAARSGASSPGSPVSPSPSSSLSSHKSVSVQTSSRPVLVQVQTQRPKPVQPPGIPIPVMSLNRRKPVVMVVNRPGLQSTKLNTDSSRPGLSSSNTEITNTQLSGNMSSNNMITQHNLRPSQSIVNSSHQSQRTVATDVNSDHVNASRNISRGNLSLSNLGVAGNVNRDIVDGRLLDQNANPVSPTATSLTSNVRGQGQGSNGIMIPIPVHNEGVTKRPGQTGQSPSAAYSSQSRVISPVVSPTSPSTSTLGARIVLSPSSPSSPSQISHPFTHPGNKTGNTAHLADTIHTAGQNTVHTVGQIMNTVNTAGQKENTVNTPGQFHDRLKQVQYRDKVSSAQSSDKPNAAQPGNMVNSIQFGNVRINQVSGSSNSGMRITHHSPGGGSVQILGPSSSIIVRTGNEGLSGQASYSGVNNVNNNNNNNNKQGPAVANKSPSVIIAKQNLAQSSNTYGATRTPVRVVQVSHKPVVLPGNKVVHHHHQPISFSFNAAEDEVYPAFPVSPEDLKVLKYI